MSTTKDKSQAELLAEREYPEHIITHETLDHSFDLHSGARKAFIKGFSAGQADRDELVKAFREVLSNYKHAVMVIGIPPENMPSIYHAEAILSRNPHHY